MEEIINEGRAEVEELLGAPLPKVESHIEVSTTGAALCWAMARAELSIGAMVPLAGQSRQSIYDSRKSINLGSLSLGKLSAVCGYALALVPTDKLGMLPEDALVIKPEDKEG